MRKKSVSIRYATLSLTLMASLFQPAMVGAAPLCANVFTPSMSTPLNGLFDQLAELTMQSDHEKMLGLQNSFLQRELKKKKAQVIEKLQISEAELNSEIKLRTARLQSNQLEQSKKEVRAREEQKEALQPTVRLKLVEDLAAPPMNEFAAFGNFAKGKTTVFLYDHKKDNQLPELYAVNPITKKTKQIADEVITSAIDPTGKTIVVVAHGWDQQLGRKARQIQFYSVATLKPSAPALTLDWTFQADNIYDFAQNITFSADGNSFAIRSSMGVVWSGFKTVNQIKTEKLPALQDVVVLDTQEIVSSSQITVSLTKTGGSYPLPPPLALPAKAFMKKLFLLEGERVLAMTKDALITVNAAQWKVDHFVNHELIDLVVIPEDLNFYVVGIQKDHLILSDINNSFVEEIGLPQGFEAKTIHLSADKKGIIVEGSLGLSKRHYLYFERRT